jgi:hypothetical protein
LVDVAQVLLLKSFFNIRPPGAHFQPQDEHLVLHLCSLPVCLVGEAQVLLLKSFFNIRPPTSNLRMST